MVNLFIAESAQKNQPYSHQGCASVPSVCPCFLVLLQESEIEGQHYFAEFTGIAALCFVAQQSSDCTVRPVAKRRGEREAGGVPPPCSGGSPPPHHSGGGPWIMRFAHMAHGPQGGSVKNSVCCRLVEFLVWVEVFGLGCSRLAVMRWRTGFGER